MILAGGVAGWLVAFLYISYWPYKVYILEEAQQAYDILRDLTTIIVAIIAILAALGGIVIGWLLHRTLYGELSEKVTSKMQEWGDCIFANLHKKTAALWGQLYERFKYDDMIRTAIGEAKESVRFANQIDEEAHRDLKLEAINNLLMSLSERGLIQDSDEVHKNRANLERLLEKYRQDLTILEYQEYLDTIYFVRWRFPLNREDKKEARKQFLSLSSHPEFSSWMRRWRRFGLRASNP